jgi:acyl-CoA thioesterase-1
VKIFRRLRMRAIAAASGAVLLSLTSGMAASAHPIVIAHTTFASKSGPVVVAIGDSIVEGHGLDPSAAWPALLAEENGWRLTNLASDGSGFVTVGNNGDTFADQVEAAVKLRPSIVLLSGSSNDLGDDDASIAKATAQAIEHLRHALPHAQIVAVSPVWNDTQVPAQLRTIDADVVTAITAVGGSYLEVGQPFYDRRSLVQDDDVHPTNTGQEVLASAIENDLAADGLA